VRHSQLCDGVHLHLQLLHMILRELLVDQREVGTRQRVLQVVEPTAPGDGGGVRSGVSSGNSGRSVTVKLGMCSGHAYAAASGHRTGAWQDGLRLLLLCCIHPCSPATAVRLSIPSALSQQSQQQPPRVSPTNTPPPHRGKLVVFFEDLPEPRPVGLDVVLQVAGSRIQVLQLRPQRLTLAGGRAPTTGPEGRALRWLCSGWEEPGRVGEGGEGVYGRSKAWAVNEPRIICCLMTGPGTSSVCCLPACTPAHPPTPDTLTPDTYLLLVICCPLRAAPAWTAPGTWLSPLPPFSGKTG
jgi:hypothetical protein